MASIVLLKAFTPQACFGFLIGMHLAKHCNWAVLKTIPKKTCHTGGNGVKDLFTRKQFILLKTTIL
ncbi:MAG: hypothetical protein JEZ02_15695 [Desulfatibacillum sp.]|nr:hypothetical protein [Desulfatibacillum sp.]